MSESIHLRSIKGAPSPVGPYSVAVEINGLVFLAGQGGINPADGTVPVSVEDQTRQTMVNLAAVLADLGLALSDVVKSSIFLIDMADFGAVNQVYASFFDSDPPARTTVGVASLPLASLKVEIDMVAAR
jgi:2-iminobutanoate/2-iminopropanoate deaminase